MTLNLGTMRAELRLCFVMLERSDTCMRGVTISSSGSQNRHQSSSVANRLALSRSKREETSLASPGNGTRSTKSRHSLASRSRQVPSVEPKSIT